MYEVAADEGGSKGVEFAAFLTTSVVFGKPFLKFELGEDKISNRKCHG